MLKLILIAFILLPIAKAKEACQHDKTNFRCVEYVRNYDADTITFKIPHIHPLFGENIPIRVKGVDTPEIRTKDKCEKEAAYIAKARVSEILKKAKRIDLINIERGKYFRVVADVVVDGHSLSKDLLEQHMAYDYDGGTKKAVNWCELKTRFPAQSK